MPVSTDARSILAPFFSFSFISWLTPQENKSFSFHSSYRAVVPLVLLSSTLQPPSALVLPNGFTTLKAALQFSLAHGRFFFTSRGFWFPNDYSLSQTLSSHRCRLLSFAEEKLWQSLYFSAILVFPCSYALKLFAIAHLFCYFLDLNSKCQFQDKWKLNELNNLQQHKKYKPSRLLLPHCLPLHLFRRCNIGQAPKIAWVLCWTNFTTFSLKWGAKRTFGALRCPRDYFYLWFGHLLSFKHNWSFNTELLSVASHWTQLSRTILYSHPLPSKVLRHTMSGQLILAVRIKNVLANDLVPFLIPYMTSCSKWLLMVQIR